MTIPARRDPAAEALHLAAIRMQEGPYRGVQIAFRPDGWPDQPWLYCDGQTLGRSKTSDAARRAVDELLSKETRV